MIDYLDNFFNESKQHSIGLGEIIGADLLQMVVDQAMSKIDFKNILIIEGCQDFIGLYKTKLPNHIFYAGILLNELNSRAKQFNAFYPKWCQEKSSYKRKINDTILVQYDLVIINNANLMPVHLIQDIIGKTPGQVIIIGDPFALNGEPLLDYPTLVDSLNKMSPSLAIARQLYGIESRSIDKNIKTDIREVKIPKRSIGKLDKIQYVTNDPVLLKDIRDKQYSIKLRKGLKVMITSDMIYHYQQTFVTRNSLGIITQTPTQQKPMFEMRLWNSKDTFIETLSYEENKSSLSPVQIQPANILSIDEAIHHRYQTLHLVLTDGDITVKEYYSLLKITNNFLISRV